MHKTAVRQRVSIGYVEGTRYPTTGALTIPILTFDRTTARQRRRTAEISAAMPGQSQAGRSDDDRAAALDQHDIAPHPVVAADLLPGPDDAEAAPLVQGQARGVFREDPGLDRPDAASLRRRDERVEQ